MWSFIWPAFFLGLLSSLHCVGMCGPLVLSLPLQGLGSGRRGLAVFGYHFGRIGVYALLGLISGVLGRGVRLAGFQQGLSISLGILIIGIALVGRGIRMGGFFSVLQRMIYRLWNSSSRSKFVVMGMANGLLPCGMVYLALAGAMSTSGGVDAVGFMLFFGVGTLPLLLGAGYYGRRAGLAIRELMQKLLPFVIASMGVLLILRGLGIGIPFISPVLPAGNGPAVQCH